jgi:hypothetical protein
VKHDELARAMKPTVLKLDGEGDAFFMMHFSRESDTFRGGDSGLDSLDMGIVIEQFFRIVASKLARTDSPAFIAYGQLAQIEEEIKRLKSMIEDDVNGGPMPGMPN